MSIYGSSKTCCANICQLKPIRLASTENIVGTSSGNYFTINDTIPYTIDGVEIELGDLVLLKDQTDEGENGVYKVTTLEDNNIVLTRYCYFNARCCNYKIYISEGDTLANSLWYYVQNVDYTLGDPINFIRDDGGGGGDVTDGANVGGDVEVFKQKNGSILEFRTLTEGTNITITQNVDTITFDAVGDINSAINLGAGSQVYKQKVGNTFEFRTLVAGSNVVLTQASDIITISAMGGGGGSTGRSFNLEENQLRVRRATPFLTSVFAWDQSQYSSFTSATCTFYADIDTREITVSIDDAFGGNLGSVTTMGDGIYAFGFTLPVADTYLEIYTNHDGSPGPNQSLINGLTLNFYE